MAMMETQENLAALELHYVNMLPQEGFVLHLLNTPMTECYYVMGSSLYGVAALKCAATKSRSGSFIFNVRVGGAIQPTLLHLKSWTGWRVRDVVVSAPWHKDHQGHILLTAGAKSEKLLDHAARHAFAGLTSNYLDKLLIALKVDTQCTRSSPLADKLLSLMRHVLPSLKDDECQAILQKRGHHFKAKFEDCLPKGSELYLGDVNIEEAREAVEIMDEVTKEKLKRHKPGAKKNIARKKAAPLSGRAELGIDEIKALLPDMTGCTAQIEKTWHHRVRISYPRQEAPYSCSRTYKQQDWPSMAKAAREALQWAWEQHGEMTGEACPWAFE